jgi:hypothetical protein
MRLGRSERLTKASNMRRCLRIVSCCERFGLTAGCAKARAVGSRGLQSIDHSRAIATIFEREATSDPRIFHGASESLQKSDPLRFCQYLYASSQSRMANECLLSACMKMNFSLERPLSILYMLGRDVLSIHIKGSSSVLCYPCPDAILMSAHAGRATAYVLLKRIVSHHNRLNAAIQLPSDLCLVGIDAFSYLDCPPDLNKCDV